jgi:hypothetical protein
MPLMPRYTKSREDACVAAYVAGWRQYDNGDWWRFGTERDALTLHRKPETLGEDDEEPEFGFVVASTPEEALRIDRETFGRRAA